MSALFLGASWKDDARHWPGVEGYADRLDQLFDVLPDSSAVMEDYVRFLYYVGERSMPAAFIRIARRLDAGDRGNLLRGKNTVFMLESLLRRHVYARPEALKREAKLRSSVLCLLDALVVAGSSAAFRMRDDFVTPLSGASARVDPKPQASG